jgi:bifunctional non-homologous end joining protein LigD
VQAVEGRNVDAFTARPGPAPAARVHPSRSIPFSPRAAGIVCHIDSRTGARQQIRPMLMRSPLARERRSPAGFIRPAQPVLADRPPIGPGWSFEIKHDGFRIVSRKDGERVRLWSRNARDWSVEFRAIAEAVRALPFSGVVLDGEAVAHCDEGLPDFHGLLGDGAASACLYAFDLLAVEGEDLRRLPLEARRERLGAVLAEAGSALRLSEHLDGDGALIFAHACRLGPEGLVAKRKGSAYRSGRCASWVKVKNPAYVRR